MKTRAPLVIAAVIFLLHLSVSWRYGFFRDELYFIDCGRHPAFGYVDQPPLVPLLAAATQAFGIHLVPLRLLAGLAHALTALVSAALAGLVAEEAGARGLFARAAAAAAVGLAPMYTGLHSTLNTTVFEPLAWTVVAYALARAVSRDERRWLVVAGVVSGVALEAKYALPFFLGPLLVGVVASPSRRVLLTRQAALGAVAAALIALPSLGWQYAHGLPFLELLRAGSHGKNTVVPPVEFTVNQLLVMNPALAPFWLLGVGYALFAPKLARVRFLAVGFIAVFVVMMLLHGKDYYVAPAYGTAFALGGAAAEVLVPKTAVRAVWLATACAFFALGLPTSMPLLDPPALETFLRVMGTRPQSQENSQKGAALPQLQADELGWPELEQAVAGVWRALPEEERAKAAIITGNYGEAGALNLFGEADGLPRALSGHNQYWLWGPGDHDGSVVIRVGGDLERWKEFCPSVAVAARFGVPYAMPYERDRPILLCRGMTRRLPDMWGDFKHYE